MFPVARAVLLSMREREDFGLGELSPGARYLSRSSADSDIK